MPLCTTNEASWGDIQKFSSWYSKSTSQPSLALPQPGQTDAMKNQPSVPTSCKWTRLYLIQVFEWCFRHLSLSLSFFFITPLLKTICLRLRHNIISNHEKQDTKPSWVYILLNCELAWGLPVSLGSSLTNRTLAKGRSHQRFTQHEFCFQFMIWKLSPPLYGGPPDMFEGNLIHKELLTT